MPGPRRSTLAPAALLVALVALVAACVPGADVRTVPLGEVEPLTLDAIDGRTRIERFDPPGAGERLQLQVGALARNDNPFGVRLDRVDYRVVLNDATVAEGALEPGAFLEPDGGTAPLLFPVDAALPPRRPLLAAVARAFTGEPLPYRIEGTMRFSAGGHAFDVRDGTLLSGTILPRETVAPPRVRHDFESSRAFELRPGVPVLQISAGVSNPGEIGYLLTGKDVALRMGGVEVARLDVGPVPVPAGAERRLELLFYPDRARLEPAGLRALNQALAGTPTDFEVRGELAMDVLGVESFPVPGGLTFDGFVHAR